MKKRKSILYLLIAILFVVLFYNYIIAPIIIQNTGGMGMGMGMHRGMYNNYNFNIDIRYIILLVAAIAGFGIYEILQYSRESKKCDKCGYEVKDGRWKVCPICGIALNKRKGDSI